MRERILIVEDEDAIRELVSVNLQRAGFSVRDVATGGAALVQSEVWRPDLLILDLLLPDVSGLDVCRRLRERGAELGWPGVIVLTALGGESDRVAGLEVGADDYVTKPFSSRELVARVRAVLRRRRQDGRGGGGGPAMRQVGDLSVHLERLEVRVGDRPTEPLTATEFRILVALVENAGRVLGREQLIDRIWGPGYYAGPRTVDVHIRHIREKLEAAGSGAPIETVRGFGYRIVTADTQARGGGAAGAGA